MSSVDNRIVKMQFDNAQFEQGVSKSMATLDKLEEKLQFKKSSSGLQNLQVAVNSVDFGRFADSIESINNKLSATGVAAAEVVKRITNSLIDGAKQIEQATIGQIKSGGWNRAMNIENAKFSIEGLKEDWGELYKAMDYAVTGTAYGIDQAATAAASLVASGVGYTEVIDKVGDTNVTAMHKALRAISGVAAQTNSDFASISRIFTTVAGQGRLMGDQLNQLAARGMNAAAKLAETLGTTEAEVRAAVSAGAIDFETFAFAMDDAFGEHATDANKTFTGSLSNMKAALSRFGAVFATPVIQDTNKFFIALTDRIKEMKNAISDVTANGEVLEEHLESHFSQMWKELITLSDTLVHKIDLEWFWRIADAADAATVRIRDLLSTLNGIFGKEAEGLNETGEKVYNLATITEAELELAEKVIQGAYGTGQKRVKALGDAASALGLDAGKIQAYVNVVAKYGYSFEKAGIKIAEFSDAEEEAEHGLSSQTISNLTIAMHNFGIATDNVRNIFYSFLNVIDDASMDELGGEISSISYFIRQLSADAASTSRSILNNFDSLVPLAEAIGNIKSSVMTVISSVRMLIEDIGATVSETFRWWAYNGELAETLQNIGIMAQNLKKAINNLGTSIHRLVMSVLRAFLRVLSPSQLTGVLADFSYGITTLTQNFILTEEGAARLEEVFVSIFTIIQNVALAVGNVVTNFVDFIAGLRGTEKETKKTSGILGVFGAGFGLIFTAVTKALDVLANLPVILTKVSDALRENEGVQRLKTAVSDLWTTVSDTVKNGLLPFQEAIADIDGSDPSEVTITRIANAIGWLADKIAIVVEKIPDVIKAVVGFFEIVKTKATEAYEWLDDKIDFGSIKTKIDSLFNNEDGKTLGDHITEFFGKVYDWITKGLEEIDWEKVGTGSITLGVLAVLWELATLSEKSSDLVVAITGIPKAISGVFKSFTSMFNSAASFTKNVGVAALIASIAAAILAIASAIVLLKDINEDDFQRVADMMLQITGYIAIVFWAVSRIVKHWASVQLSRNTVEMIRADIAKTLSSLVGAAIDYIGIAAAVWLIIKAITEIYEAVTYAGFDPIGFVVAIGAIVVIMFILVLAVKSVMKASRQLFTTLKAAGMTLTESIGAAQAFGVLLVGVGLILAGLGAAVYLIAKAAVEIDANAPSLGSIILVGGLIAVLTYAITQIITAITNSPRNLKIGDILGFAAIIFVFSLGLVGIIGAVIGLTLITTLGNFVGMGPTLEIIFAEVIGLIFVLGYAMGQVLNGISKLQGIKPAAVWAVVAMLGIMSGIILAVGYAVVKMTEALSELPSDFGGILNPIDGMVLMLTVILGGLALTLLALGKSNLTDKQLFALASVVASIGAMLLMMAGAFAIIGEAVQKMDGASIAVTMVMIFGVLSIAVLGLIGIMVIAAQLGTAAPSVLMAAGVAMVLIAATLLVMAGALYIISTINWSVGTVIASLAAMSVMLLMLGILGAIAVLANSIPDFGTNIILAATSVVIMSASLLVFAAACYVLQSIDPGIIRSAIAAMVVMMVGLLLIGLVLGKIGDKAVQVLKYFALAALSLGLTIVIAAAGVLLMGVALQKLALVLPIFTIALAQFFKVVKDNQVIAIIALVAFTIVLVTLLIVMMKLGPTLNALFQTAATVLEKGVQLLGAGAAKIGQFISNTISSISKASPKVKLMVVSLIGSLLSALTESGPKVLQTIGKLLIMLMDWLADAIGPLAEKLVDLLIKLLDGLRKAIQSHSNQIAAAIFNIIYAILDLAMSLINQILRPIVSAFMGGGWYDSHIGKKIAETQEGLRLMADENMAAAKGMDELANEGSSAWADWMEKVGEVTDEMEKQDRTDYLGRIQDKIDSGIPMSLDNLKEKFGDTFDIDPGKFNIEATEIDPSSIPSAQIEDMIKKGMADYDEDGTLWKFSANPVVDVNGEANVNLTPNFNQDDIMAQAGDIGLDSGMEFSDMQAFGINEGQSEVVQATDSNVDAQINAINDRQDDLKQAGKDSSKAVAKGVGDEYQTLYKAGGDVVDGLSKRISTFATATSAVTGSGRYYGYEAANAIKDGWDLGIEGWPEQLRSQFTEAQYAAKDAFIGPPGFDIHSPSKVTRWWGEMIINGLTNGIADNQENAITSMEDLSNAMIVSFGNPLEYAAKIASGEIEYDPSIRPILDTSNIASGAYGINSLFDNQNVAISGFSGKLATDISGLDTTNSQMVNELRSLRSDMNNMTEQITNMQIVMDGGQLVGAIAPTMDTALGRRAIHKGRGN